MDSTDRTRERGQVLVLFALSALAMILMVGLVLDGGSTYGQRRSQQNAADLAALAGANAWLLDGGDAASKAAAATATAQLVASQNGFQDAANDVVVTVDPQPYGTAGGQSVKVDVTGKHYNAFAGMVGMKTWDVSVTATAVTGLGGGPRGVAPILFLNSTFVNGSGDMLPQYSNPLSPFTFGEANGDVPVSPNDISWTVFASPANLNTNTVRNIINGSDQLSRPVTFGQYIGQHNNGNHTALYSDVDQYLGRPDAHGSDRRHRRQLPGLGDVPRGQRVRRLEQDHHRILHDGILRGPRGLHELSGLPGHLRRNQGSQAHQLGSPRV